MMISTQYHCGCCNQVVDSAEHDCPNCGSHNIRSPYGFWIFCVVTCLVVAVVFKLTQVYFQAPHELPKTYNLVQVMSNQHSK